MTSKPDSPAIAAAKAQPIEVMSPRELRPGMIVSAHGMLCLVRDEPTKSTAHPDRNGGCFWTKTLVINRAAVSSDRVPYSFTEPRRINGYPDDAAIAAGEHHWSLQGNDLARVAVLVHGPQTS